MGIVDSAHEAGPVAYDATGPLVMSRGVYSAGRLRNVRLVRHCPVFVVTRAVWDMSDMWDSSLHRRAPRYRCGNAILLGLRPSSGNVDAFPLEGIVACAGLAISFQET